MVGIGDDEPVERLRPVRGEPRVLVRALAVFAVLAGAIGAATIALSPGLRRRLAAVRTPPVPISVDSTPSGADVFIDEESPGKTPIQARLAPGRHVVRIVHVGYRPWRQTFDPAQKRRLSPVLQPLALATLIVESEPGGADVLLDGARRGTTPIRLHNLEPGAHAVRIAAEPLYHAVAHDVELKARETRRLSVRLPSRIEAFYRDQIEKQPAKLANYTELVHHYLQEGRAAEGVATTTKALRILDGAEASATEHGQFYVQLDLVCSGRAAGISDAAKGELLGAALAAFGKLAAAKADEPEHYLPIAKVLEGAGGFAKVLEACDGAAQRAGATGIVHVHVAEAYLDGGELASGIALLEHATRLRPDAFEAHCHLGAAYRRGERYDDALRAYEAAEKLAASAPAEGRRRLQTEIARLLAHKGDIDGAVARYEKALGLEAPSGGIDLARGLIVHYPFDKDASDASGKGHHGEAHGATPVAGGSLGGAFSFDGVDDYVSIPARATGGLTAATFALWVKTTQARASPRGGFWAHPTLLGAATDGYGSGDLGLMLKGGNVAYFHGLTPDERDLSWSSEVSVSDGTWHHIALVNAGPLVLLYVDGRLARGEAFSLGGGASPLGVQSDTPSGGTVCTAPLLIGASNHAFARASAASFHRGLIDDVRIWNRALAAREIAALCAKAQ